jgi:hypothetical protein
LVIATSQAGADRFAGVASALLYVAESISKTAGFETYTVAVHAGKPPIGRALRRLPRNAADPRIDPAACWPRQSYYFAQKFRANIDEQLDAHHRAAAAPPH